VAYQVKPAIVVDIRRRDRYRPKTNDSGQGCLKGSVPIAQQHADPAAIGYYQVKLTVLVDVRCRRVVRLARDRIGDRRQGRAVAVAHENTYRVGSAARHGKVDGTVAVEIGRHDIACAYAGVISAGNMEGAVAIIQEHGHLRWPTGTVEIGYRQIQMAVTVEI